MKKNPNLYDLQDVCSYFGLSEASIRRKVRATRAGEGCFPLPLFETGCRLLWRSIDITGWAGENGEVIDYTPAITTVPKATMQSHSTAIANATLESLGVKLPSKKLNP